MMTAAVREVDREAGYEDQRLREKRADRMERVKNVWNKKVN